MQADFHVFCVFGHPPSSRGLPVSHAAIYTHNQTMEHAKFIDWLVPDVTLPEAMAVSVCRVLSPSIYIHITHLFSIQFLIVLLLLMEYLICRRCMHAYHCLYWFCYYYYRNVCQMSEFGSDCGRRNAFVRRELITFLDWNFSNIKYI